jgi:excisionase family DNA binding protein
MSQVLSKWTAEVLGDGLLPIPDAARWLGVGRSTLYLLMKGRQLEWVEVRHRRLIPRKALVALAARGLKGGRP